MSALTQITRMRLPQGTEVAFVDWEDKPLYSTVEFLHGFTDDVVRCFTYVTGDQVPGTANLTVRREATDQDTNLSTPGSMASTEEMLVYSIRPEIFQLETLAGTPTSAVAATPANPGDPIPAGNRLGIMNLLLILKLFISQKVYTQAGLGYYNAGFGPWAAFGDVNAAGVLRSYGSQGLPSNEAVRSLALPIHIGGQEKYRIELHNDSGEVGVIGLNEATPPVANTRLLLRYRIYLDGLYKRPVQ